MSLKTRRHRPTSRRRRPRADQLSRLDRRFVGGAVLASQGLHAGLHDRARLHGEDQARVRQAQREDHRPVGRSASTTRSGPPTSRRRRGTAQLPDHRRRRLQRLEALRDAAGGARRATRERTPADNQTVRNVFVVGPDKKVKLDPRLPDDDGPQLRRGAARDRLAAADREAPGRDAGQLAAGRGRDHRRLGVERRGEGDLRRGWESPKPYIRIVPQPDTTRVEA